MYLNDSLENKMIPFRKFVLFFTSWCFMVYSLKAQEHYRSEQWGLKDGLSQACVFHMLQDTNGFLWMGTQGGLSRFDGSTFKNFYHDPKKSGTINAKYTANGLVEDSLHNIWIGTNNGLFRYDIKAVTFTHFEQGAPLVATKDVILCLGSPDSIISYNTHSFAKKNVAVLTPADSVGNDLNVFSSYYDQRTNSLWMLRSFRVKNTWFGSGLLEISLTTGKKKHYNWNCYKNISGHDHSAEAMCYDKKRNCLWINSGEGLMQFTLDNHQFQYIGAFNNFFKPKDYYRWVGICMDLQNRVWLATLPKGIAIYDPSDHSVELPFAENAEVQNEISENNAILYCDRNGSIWSGFWLGKGIYQILPFSPTFIHYSTDTSIFNIGTIYNFQNVGQGKIWIGSLDRSHRIFDTHTGTYQKISELDLPPDLRNTQIIPLMIDTISQNAFLFNFTKGLQVLNLNSKKSQLILFKNAKNQEVMVSPIRLGYTSFKNGFLVSGIQDNIQSVFFVNGASMMAHEMFSFPIQQDNGFKLKMADDQSVFLNRRTRSGVQNLIFTNHNNKWVQTAHPLDSIAWNHIIYNIKEKDYWVAAENELIHYSKDFRKMHEYNPSNGLPEWDIYSLLTDTRGNIWFNTDRSIHQLNIETGAISTLSEKDGFISENFTPGVQLYLGLDGDLYLGGGDEGEGFVKISPEKYTKTSSSIYIKSFEINQKPYTTSIGANNLQELFLTYDQNKIGIETGIIDYYSKGRGQIRYMLEGINEIWQYGPANYTIRFDGLQPGDYPIKMQSSNAANEFNGPVKSLLIHINVPWWRTWWAYVLYSLTFIGALQIFSKWRERHLRSEKEQLEIKVNERTISLKATLLNLQSTQAQLIQSEKMASLGELTAGIAHEIQNPLNFVNNFSEINNEMLEEMKQELAIGNKQLAMGNKQLARSNWQRASELANDIESNSEKINHHGKRAESIVKGMLEHSRKSSGLKEPTDINKLCNEFVRLSYQGLRAKDKASNCEYKLDLDPDLPVLHVNPQDIGRVILNLINNAFYAVNEKSKQGIANYKPTVEVTTKKEGDKVLVRVKDNGNGISQKIVDKIFQPFFTTKPSGQGTGLGLSLAYDIVKAHGGSISVISNYREPGTIEVKTQYGPPGIDLKVETSTSGKLAKECDGAEFIIELPANKAV